MQYKPIPKFRVMALQKEKAQSSRKQPAAAPRKSSKQIRREHLWYEYI